MKNILVADIMTREPITIKPDINLLACARKMIKNRTGSLIIVDKKKLLGLLAQSDILWAITKKSKEDLKNIKATDISRKKITTIRPTATLEEAFNKMKDSKLQRLPVTQEGELVGMLTLRDILNFKPEFYPELEELSQIREEAQKLKRLEAREKEVIEGICEECGHRGFLHKFNGMLICESCMNK